MILRSVNKVIRVMIYSDVVFLSAFGLMSPIFAIFITQKIQGGSAEVAGFAAAIFWVLKAILQIPIGKYLDRNHGEKDDFYFMLFGTMLASLVPFGYMWSTLPWHIYALQGLYAFAMAMVVPSWAAIFSRHLDKNKEAFEWGTHSTFFSIGVGITGAVGGILVSQIGFNIVFGAVGIIAFAGALLLLLIANDISPENKKLPRVPEAKKLGESYLPKN